MSTTTIQPEAKSASRTLSTLSAGHYMLGASLLAGGALRLVGLDRWSLWTDELYVVWEARQPLELLCDPRVHVHHPPGYRLLLHAWIGLGGTSEWWVRLLPALAGVALIAVLWALARELWPRHTWAAPTVVLFAATSPYLVHYSQDVTSYSWASLLVALSFLLLVKAWRGNTPWRWVGWGLSLAAALYSHYFAIFPLAVQGIGLLAAGLTPLGGPDRGERLKRLRPGLAAVAGAALLFLPWAVRLFTGGGESLRQVYYAPTLDEQPLGWLPVLISGYANGGVWGSRWTWLLVWGLLAAGALWAAWRLKQRGNRREGVATFLVLGWGLAAMLGPYLFLRATTPPDAVTPVRFATIAVPALLLGLGALITSLPRLVRTVLIGAWLVMAGVQLYGAYAAPARQDWRGMLGIVKQEARTNDSFLAFTVFHTGAAAAYYPVPRHPEGGWFITEGGVTGEAAYWLPAGWQFRGFLSTRAYRNDDFRGELSQRVGTAERVWYLAGDNSDGTYPPGPGAERALAEMGWRVEREWRASPLVLRLYVR
jgi:4-amino-4-deoxy-L-arabinose transferase-like glycosyltransferase